MNTLKTTAASYGGVSGFGTDSKQRSAPQGPLKCPYCMPHSEANLEQGLKKFMLSEYERNSRINTARNRIFELYQAENEQKNSFGDG
jgi:hypothetical protein